MPLVTDTPVATIEANVWQITRFEGSLPTAGTPTMRVWVAAGMRAADGSTVWYLEREYAVSGDGLIAAYLSAPEGNTVYAVIRHALYTYAQSAGWIPAGATLQFEQVDPNDATS